MSAPRSTPVSSSDFSASASGLNPAVEAYWTSEFNRVRFERDETRRVQMIRGCFKAAGNNRGLRFRVRSDHPYFSEIKGVFGEQHLDVDVVAAFRWDMKPG